MPPHSHAGSPPLPRLPSYDNLCRRLNGRSARPSPRIPPQSISRVRRGDASTWWRNLGQEGRPQPRRRPNPKMADHQAGDCTVHRPELVAGLGMAIGIAISVSLDPVRRDFLIGLPARFIIGLSFGRIRIGPIADGAFFTSRQVVAEPQLPIFLAQKAKAGGRDPQRFSHRAVNIFSILWRDQDASTMAIGLYVNTRRWAARNSQASAARRRSSRRPGLL